MSRSSSTPHFAKRDRRFFVSEVEDRRVSQEIRRRVRALAKKEKLQTRRLLQRFYTASDHEIYRWLDCERKKIYSSSGEAEVALRNHRDGHRMTCYQCRWNKSHWHLTRRHSVERQVRRDVQVIQELLTWRRSMKQEAS